MDGVTQRPIRLNHDQASAVRDAIKADERGKDWFVTVDDIDKDGASVLIRSHEGVPAEMERVAHEIAQKELGFPVSSYDISARILQRPTPTGGLTRGGR